MGYGNLVLGVREITACETEDWTLQTWVFEGV